MSSVLGFVMADVKHIGQLTPDPKNARQHNARNIGMIVDSLQKVGGARSIVIDEDNVILAGNGVIEAAAEAGIENVLVIEASGHEIIAVRRRGLTEEQKTLLKYYDNRTAELADWDASQIVADLETDMDLSGLWSDDEIAELVAGVMEEPSEDPGPQIDRAEELREKWQTARGQIWEIPSKIVAGKCHRVMCGDSTSEEDIERLMEGQKAVLCLTDPPYGIGETFGSYEDTPDSLQALVAKFLPLVRSVSDRTLLTPGNSHQFIYPKPDWVLAWFVSAGVGCNPWGFTCWNAMFAYGSDPYLAAGLGSRPDALVRTEASEKLAHPTVKPIGVWSWFLERGSVNKGDLILDPFLGSGTTMVAAEQLGRVCYGMEIHPSYVAVTLQRLADMGLEPRLVVEQVERNGGTHQ